MLSFAEYRKYDAVDLAKLVATGEVSASELLETAINRADAINKRINAVILPMYEIARDQAQKNLIGKLSGVPFLLKDLRQDYKGAVTTNGCVGLKQAAVKANFHSTFTERLLDAGAVIFGKTNVSEFGCKGITEPDAWGPTRNPWNLSLSPGGSSGGASAAVAAGITPVAGASDAGGSIRIPASYCGLFGLKPSRGRTPMGPMLGEIMHGASTHHVVSRSVRDSATILDVVSGSEPTNFFKISPSSRRYIEETETDCDVLRVGLSCESILGATIHPEAILAVENTAKLLESLGHHVEWSAPTINWNQLAYDFSIILFGYCAFMVMQTKDALKIKQSRFERDTLIMANFGRKMTGITYVNSYMRINEYVREAGKFFKKFDIYLTPTVASSPPLVGSTSNSPFQYYVLQAIDRLGLTRAFLDSPLIQRIITKSISRTPFTQLANLTGAPAMSVPLHWGGDGQPWGVHFTASHAREDILIRLAAQLERAVPWFDKTPD